METVWNDDKPLRHNSRRIWWRHQMETFSALLAICAENSPVPGEFPTQRPVTLSVDVYFDLRPNKRLSKETWGWWFETPSRPLWRHRNERAVMGECAYFVTSCWILTLTAPVFQMPLDLTLPREVPITFRLTEGSGPIHVTAQHIVGE